MSELEVERTGKGGRENRSAAVEEANVKGETNNSRLPAAKGFLR